MHLYRFIYMCTYMCIYIYIRATSLSMKTIQKNKKTSINILIVSARPSTCMDITYKGEFRRESSGEVEKCQFLHPEAKTNKNMFFERSWGGLGGRFATFCRGLGGAFVDGFGDAFGGGGKKQYSKPVKSL